MLAGLDRLISSAAIVCRRKPKLMKNFGWGMDPMGHPQKTGNNENGVTTMPLRIVR